MTDTIKKDSEKKTFKFLDGKVHAEPKTSGRFKWKLDLGRKHAKVKNIYIEDKKVGRYKEFMTLTEIDQYLRRIEKESSNTDLNVSSDTKRDWLNARDVLDKKGYHNISVFEAVQKWVKDQPVLTNETVREAWEEFMTYKIEEDGIKKATQKSLENCGLRSLEPWLDRPLTDFQSDALVGKLTKYINKNWKKRSRINHFTKTSEFFGWCATCSPKKINRNPLQDRRKITAPTAKKNIVTVEQAERILNEAWKTDKEEGMLAYWVITLFLGCRPQSEMQWMTWDDVYFNDPDNSFLHVRESKTGEERRVDLTPQAYEWLMICNRKLPIFKRGKDRDGNDIPSFHWYNKNRRDILKKAGVLNDSMSLEEKKSWQDFQRHTCASAMWWSGEYDATDISNKLDHSEATSRKFYKNKLFSKPDAQRYLKIRPSTIGEKIIKIA